MNALADADRQDAVETSAPSTRPVWFKLLFAAVVFAGLPAIVAREHGRASAVLLLLVFVGAIVVATFALAPKLGFRRGVALAIGFPVWGVTIAVRSVWRLASRDRYWAGTLYPGRWTLPWKLLAWIGALFLASALAGVPALVSNLPAGHTLTGDVPAQIETVDDLLDQAGFVLRQGGRSLVVMEERRPSTATGPAPVLALWLRRGSGPFSGWEVRSHSSVNVVEGAKQEVVPGRRPVWIFRSLAPDASWVEARFEGGISGGGVAASGYAVIFGPAGRDLTGWRAHALDGGVLVDYSPPAPTPSPAGESPRPPE